MQPLAMNLRATIPVIRTYVYVIPLWFKSKVIYGLEKWELQQLVWNDLGLAVRIHPYKQVCQAWGGGGGGSGCSGTIRHRLQNTGGPCEPCCACQVSTAASLQCKLCFVVDLLMMGRVRIN